MDWTIETIIEIVQDAKERIECDIINPTMVFMSEDVFTKIRQSGDLSLELVGHQGHWSFLGLHVYIVRQPLTKLTYFLKVV